MNKLKAFVGSYRLPLPVVGGRSFVYKMNAGRKEYWTGSGWSRSLCDACLYMCNANATVDALALESGETPAIDVNIIIE